MIFGNNKNLPQHHPMTLDNRPECRAGARPIHQIHLERQIRLSEIMFQRRYQAQRQGGFADDGEVEVGVGFGGAGGARAEGPDGFVRNMTVEDGSHDFPLSGADRDVRQRAHRRLMA